MEENNENVQTAESIEETKTAKNNKIIKTCVIIAAVVLVIVAIYLIFNKNGLGSKNIVGYYELYEMSSDDEDYSYEDLQNLKSLGLEVTLELRDDKTGTLNLFGETMDLTYDNKNMTVDGEYAPYKVDDNKITMEQDGQKLVFQKAEKAENLEEQK